MTTIAFDGKLLAADTLIIEGSVIIGYQPKVFKVKGGYIGGVGRADDISAYVEWVRGGFGEKPELTEGEDFIGMFITNGGQVFEYGEKLNGFALPPGMYAWGSGGLMALAAMRLGISAPDAIQFAIDNTIDSGGTIDVFEVVRHG